MVSTTKAKRVAGGEGEVVVERQPWYARLLADRSPLGFNAGDTNLYRYVGDNPTDATDPSGLDEYDWKKEAENWERLNNENLRKKIASGEQGERIKPSLPWRLR